MERRWRIPGKSRPPTVPEKGRVGETQVSPMDEKRKAARWRQRRIIYNNDGDDVREPVTFLQRPNAGSPVIC